MRYMQRLTGAVALLMMFLIVAMPASIAVSIDESTIHAEHVSPTAVKIMWETDTQASGFVDYGTSISRMTSIPETGGARTSHSVELSQLDKSTKYYYRVLSEDLAGPDTSGYFDFVTLLGAVEGLKLDDKGYDFIEIRWSAVLGALGFDIYRDGKKINSTSYSQRYFVDRAVSSSTRYVYKVVAVDSAGRQGGFSEELVVQTATQPVKISFVEATEITKESAKITWKTDIDSNSTVRYGKESTLDKIKVDYAKTKEHAIELTGLKPATTYYYLVESGSEESRRYNFKTFSNDTKIEISDIYVSDIGKDYAEITWKTNIPSTSNVHYSDDDSFSKKESMPGSTASHSVVLDGLEIGMTYFFKVESDGVYSESRSFTTNTQVETFLKIDNLPETTNSAAINISGESRLNSKIFIFVNDNANAQVRQRINGTKFKFGLVLDSAAVNDGTRGRNKIEVNAWDYEGKKDTKILYVFVDTAAPFLDVDDESIPSFTNKRSLNITGKTEPNITVEFYFDESRTSSVKADEAGKFFKDNFNMGTRDDNHTIKIVAIDSLGNQAVFSKHVETDFTVPKVEFETEFRGETHFKLVKIKGKTDPGAKVRAVNFGSKTGCEDVNFKNEIGISCEQFLSPDYTNPQIDVRLDPIAWFFSESTVTAGSDGKFEVSITMLADIDDKGRWKPTNNNIHFFVYDPAGNRAEVKKVLKYVPGCSDWVVAEVQTMPFNLYTREFREADIPGSASITVEYMGTGTPIVTQVAVDSHRENLGYFSQEEFWGGKQNNNDALDIETPKVTPFDEGKNSFFVYAPITIKRNKDPVDQVPDQMRGYLVATISYQVDGQKNTCPVYMPIVFDVQKPELLTNWLSPYMINQSILALDGAINITEQLIYYTQQAATWGMIACGVMIAWQYLSGLVKSAEELESSEDQCSQAQSDMEKVYWVCDRILCPPAPPQCGSFEVDVADAKYYVEGKEVGTDEYFAAQAENDRINAAYDEMKGSGDWKGQCSIEDFRAGNCADGGEYYRSGLGAYSNISAPTRYMSDEIYDEMGNRFSAYVEYIKVDENGNIDDGTGTYNIERENDDNININIKTTMQEARACKGGTLIVTRRVMSEESQARGATHILNPVQKSEALGEFEYRCVKGKGPEEIGHPDLAGIPGCYRGTCPQFDNTKCFDRDNINPAGGMWSSALCACLPGINGYLKQYLTIMQGAKKCLEQARMGEVMGGFCERLLAQFICDILTEALKLILNSVKDEQNPDIAGIGSPVRSALTGYKENAEQIGTGLSERYSGIVETKLGLTTERLVNKACIAAISGDWSMIEGLMEQLSETVEIEPIINIEGSSRPYSFDPFTGRMNIGYDLYVGIIPGGRTSVKVWMECDRNFPGGEFCGNDVDIYKVRGFYPLTMAKNDPAKDQNIFFVDENSKWWYNKLILEATYEVGGRERVEKIVREIYRKGDLSMGCDFSLLNGINCYGPQFLESDGTVGFTSGTGVSPPVLSNVYYQGNQVGALINLDNRYQKDFYIRVDYSDGRKSREYRINNDGEGYGNMESYLIWLDTIGGTTATSAPAAGGDYNIVDGLSARVKVDESSQNINLQLQNADSATVILNGRLVGGSSGMSQYKIIGDVPIVVKGGDYASYPLNLNSQVKAFIAEQKVDPAGIKFEIQKISLQGVSVPAGQAANPTVGIKDMLQPGSESQFESKYWTFVKGGPVTDGGAKSQKKVTISLLSDSDSGGRNWILYENMEQKKDISYYVSGSVPPDKPSVHFIQPTGKYFPVGNVPLGFTILNGRNKISKVEFDIKDIGKSKFAKKVTCSIGSGCDDGIMGMSSRSTYMNPDQPPFYEFILYTAGMDSGPDNRYEIKVIAYGEGEASDMVMRSFVFDQGVAGEYLTAEMVSVCLGGYDCQTWGAGVESDVGVVPINDSTRPTGRVGR